MITKQIDVIFAAGIVEWPSAFVAVSVLALIGIIMVFAIKRFDVEGVIKIWAMLGVLVGIVTGTFGTYFFTRQATEAKIAEAQTRVTTAEQQTRQTANQLNEAALQIASKQPALAAKVFGNNYIAALQTRDLSERAAAEASAPAPSPQILYNATNAAEK